MIITLTPNPSLDRTAQVAEPLTRGDVHRLRDITSQPGGKGVNVARVIHMAGQPVLALLPADDDDEVLRGLHTRGVEYQNIHTGSHVRANLTITEPDGTTTKLNEPGAELAPSTVNALQEAVIDAASGAHWAVLSGSLPPGAPVDWYGQLVQALRKTSVKIAVDTSDEPLMALASALPAGAPDLIKPNSEELGQLCGQDGQQLESAALDGDYTPILSAARSLVEQGISAVLITLGGAGALLVTADGAWRAAAPAVAVKSTVGAGDSALAGYLLAEVSGADPADRLRNAIAYGSGAAALAGSTLPRPDQVDVSAVDVTEL